MIFLFTFTSQLLINIKNKHNFKHLVSFLTVLLM